MANLYLGATHYHELAFQFTMKNAPECYWEIKKLRRGTIQRILGRRLSSKEGRVPCNDIGLLRDWDNLPDYDENERTK